MSVPLKLANFWRILSDVNLAALRTAAHARFELHVASTTGADAAHLAALLSPPGPAVHPWLSIVAADAGPAPLATSPIAAVLVTSDIHLGPPLSDVLAAYSRARVPVLTVQVGQGGDGPVPARGVETARVAVPALDVGAVNAIATALVAHVDRDVRLALGAQLPGFRPAVFAREIDETARANASFALTTGLGETIPVITAPLNLGDVVILTKNQAVMSYRLALSAGRDGDPKTMLAEILGVLGGGLLFRQAARSLVGLIPVIGIVPKVAIAYGGTWAIGKAMVAWLTEGRPITEDAIKALSREGLEKGRSIATRMAEGVTRPASARRSWAARWRRTR